MYLDLIDRALKSEYLAVDTETTGLDVYDGRDYLTGLSIAWYENNQVHSTYFPFRHPDENCDPSVLSRVKMLIEQFPGEALVFHHAKFDIPSLSTIGIQISPDQKFYDTMLMAHLIDENRPFSGKGLDSLGKYYIKEGKRKTPELELFIHLNGWGAVPSWLMFKYGAADAEITLKLFSNLLPRFVREATTSLWDQKQKLVHVLVDMQRNGILVSEDRVNYLIREGERAMEAAQAELGGMNPNSPKQLEQFLIVELGLPVLAWTKPAKGKSAFEHVPKPSFTRAVLNDYEKLLEDLYPGDTRVQAVLTYRGWTKAIGFLRSWLELRSPDGRLRPFYLMHKDPEEGGTVTGRLSCQKPNLQQIPKRATKPWANRLKACFVPAPGYVLIEADYSQLELRLATAYAREEGLRRTFEEGRDIFTEMSERLGISRDATKTFVYATQYGAGDRKIAASLGIKIGEAKKIRNDYLAAYPGFHEFSEKKQSEARNYGKAKVWSGRFRHFLDPDDEARKAMNSVIQGGAADIVERVMYACWERFCKDNDECRMLLQIHDAIVFEVREDLKDKYIELIYDTMEGVNKYVFDFKVRFAVDAHYLGKKEKL